MGVVVVSYVDESSHFAPLDPGSLVRAGAEDVLRRGLGLAYRDFLLGATILNFNDRSILCR